VKKGKAKPEPEEDEEDEKPKAKGKKKVADDECPEGYEYGTDCDEQDECFECPKWEECKAAQDAAKPAKKKK
jgi:hypothetical protein